METFSLALKRIGILGAHAYSVNGLRALETQHSPSACSKTPFPNCSLYLVPSSNHSLVTTIRELAGF